MATTYNLNNSINPVIVQDSSVPASMRDAFSEWLSDGNTKKYSPDVILSCMDRISDYAVRKRISAGSLWDYQNHSAFSPVYKKLIEAKLLRITDRNTHKVFIVVGQLYVRFLKEKPWKTEAADSTSDVAESVEVPVEQASNIEAEATPRVSASERMGTSLQVPSPAAPADIHIWNKEIEYSFQKWMEADSYPQKTADLYRRAVAQVYHNYEILAQRAIISAISPAEATKKWIAVLGDNRIFLRENSARHNQFSAALSALERYFTSGYSQGALRVQVQDNASDEYEATLTADDTNIGVYIRNKLRQLSESGFTFSSKQLQDICSLQWSKWTFRLATPHPFAKIIDKSVSLSELRKDESGYNLYWNEVFTFGNVGLVFTSQWYERNRSSFDEWLASLNSTVSALSNIATYQYSSGEKKYDPLKFWLAKNGDESVRMSFSEIAGLVGGLPSSAYQHRAFWSNTDSHPFSVAWMGAGYKVTDCDLRSQYVRFIRFESSAFANVDAIPRRITVKAALIEFSNNYKGEVKARKDIIEELSSKYGHNENSILPADYEVGLNNGLPKLFRRIDHGTYVCLGYNMTQPEAVFTSSRIAEINDEEKEKVIKIVATRFKNGFRKSSSIDFERFKNYYVDKYGEEFQYDTDLFNSLLATEALVYDDRAYIYDEDVVRSVRLHLELMGSPCIFIDTFFNKYSSEFYTFSIFSAEMLRVFIEKNYHDISVKWDYILLKENTSPSDLIKEVFGERETWSFDELQERLPYTKMDTIRQTMNGSDYFRVDKGTYIHIDNMDLPDSEGEKVVTFVESKLWEREYITANELDLSLFENLNSHCSFAAVRDAVFYKFLSDKYEKSGQVITRKGGKLRVLDIMEKYCREAETVSFEELNAFEATFDPEGRTHSQCLIAGNNTMIRVSAELFVSDSNIDFDVTRIDEAIALYCHGNFIPLRGVTDFSLFPFAGYAWNLFLLESYVRRFSRVFKYDVRAVNSANIGAIVRKSFDYNKYDDILSLALAKSSIKLSDKKAAGNYLFDNGYIGWRNLGKSESKIIKSAKVLREGGAV